MKRLAWPRYWLIDPLDGTKEFVKRNGEFTVNIALMENHVPIWGIIYAPVSCTLYAGMVEFGAWVWENPQIENISIKDGTTLPIIHKNNTLTIVGSKSYLTETTISFIEKLRKTMGNPEFIRAGSSLKFCRIATGEADVYPRMDSIMEWDIAAGQAIIEAAGGLMVKWPDNSSITYTSTNMRSPWFVAVAPGRDGKELLNSFTEK
jgi:3'(2'), 5'-bisphosphate nucleotidase